jgi:hypothetical protein
MLYPKTVLEPVPGSETVPIHVIYHMCVCKSLFYFFHFEDVTFGKKWKELKKAQGTQTKMMIMTYLENINPTNDFEWTWFDSREKPNWNELNRIINC